METPMSDQTLRSTMIRLAHENPGPLREALLPLLKTAGLDVDPEDLEVLRLIHSNKAIRGNWGEAVDNAFTTLNNAGDGYGVGREDDDISSIREAGRLIDTVNHNQIAVYWNSRHLTLVADIDGPWAVDVDV